jgi:putative FmdB family regulatory protein
MSVVSGALSVVHAGIDDSGRNLHPTTDNGQTKMPTYEYKCDACGKEFEKFQPITSSPVKKCPKCGKNKVRRLISAGAGLIFKGSGFYITDYRDPGYSEKAKADTAAASEKPAESKPGESKSDSSKPSENKPAETKAEKPATTESAPKAESKPQPRASKSARKK